MDNLIDIGVFLRILSSRSSHVAKTIMSQALSGLSQTLNAKVILSEGIDESCFSDTKVILACPNHLLLKKG
jgi:hypothetical protein